MQVSRAASIWLEYHRSLSRENTLKAYQASSGIFLGEFADRQIGEMSTGDILSFLNWVTEGKKLLTGRIRYTLSTPQRYLGKVTDSKAIRWIDNLYR